MKTLNKYFPTILLLVLMFGLSLATKTSPFFTETLALSPAGFYFSISLLLLVAIGITRIEKYVTMPLFAWAILFGIALQTPFHYLLSDKNALLVLIELFAAFILFTAGITVPVKNFKKYFAPIATLSLLGTMLSVLIFAVILSVITALYGFNISAISLILIAAILSSIDPTTILPTLEHLHFKRPFLKDIAVSESAVNDVVGMVITRFFLIAALGATATTATYSVSEEFSTLFSRTALDFFSVVTVWGIMVGLLGGWILRTWGETVGKKHWSDPALFISVPILCLALGSLIPGAGFLAAFVAGLTYEVHHRAREVHLFFESLVEKLLRPTVFILLGALVPLATLAQPNVIFIGTFASIAFMFFVRPLVVYISLLPWMIAKHSLLSWREVLFLSFIRETGAIAAVLMLYIFASGFTHHIELIFSIGVWVMLYTLIIEPPLTPLLAKRLEIGKEE